MEKLIDRDGTLYLGDEVLLYIYPRTEHSMGGDCDSIRWPNPNLTHLAACLYDEREMGNVKGNVVELPDGSTLEF